MAIFCKMGSPDTPCHKKGFSLIDRLRFALVLSARTLHHRAIFFIDLDGFKTEGPRSILGGVVAVALVALAKMWSSGDKGGRSQAPAKSSAPRGSLPTSAGPAPGDRPVFGKRG